MTPTHANKKGTRYRYYVSSALAQGRHEEAGSVARVPAVDVENVVVEALRQHRPDQGGVDDEELIASSVERVTVGAQGLQIALVPDPAASSANLDRQGSAQDEGENFWAATKDVTYAPSIHVPWSPAAQKRRREVSLPLAPERTPSRPIRSDTRATLLRNIALGRRWLQELVAGSVSGPEAIAAREGCSKRHVATTISLAFLAPDLVKAAVEGGLPARVGVARLIDAPMEWSRQRQMLGLEG